VDIASIVTFVLERVLPDMARAVRDAGGCLSQMSPGLIFVHTKASAEALAEELTRALSLEVPFVTSDISEERRAAIAKALREGLLPMAVCTDAWSAGIDIPALRWIAVEAWTRAPIGLRQRVGRGARLASGKTDFAIYVLPGGRYEREVREVLERADAAVPADEPSDPMQIIHPPRRSGRGSGGGRSRGYRNGRSVDPEQPLAPFFDTGPIMWIILTFFAVACLCSIFK